MDRIHGKRPYESFGKRLVGPSGMRHERFVRTSPFFCRHGNCRANTHFSLSKMLERSRKKIPDSIFFKQDGKYYVIGTEIDFTPADAANSKFRSGKFTEDHTRELVWIPVAELRRFIQFGKPNVPTKLQTVSGSTFALHRFAGELICGSLAFPELSLRSFISNGIEIFV
jgi:hypothetical protein